MKSTLFQRTVCFFEREYGDMLGFRFDSVFYAMMEKTETGGNYENIDH